MNTPSSKLPIYPQKFRSLGTKLTVLVSITAVALAAFAIFISYRVHGSTEDQFYIDLTRRIGNTVANQLDKDEVYTLAQAVQDESIKDAVKAKDYDAVKNWLKRQKLYDICVSIQEKLHRMKEDSEVKFLYLQTQSGQLSIVLADAEDDIGTFGQTTENEPEFGYVTTNMRVEAGVSNGEYGWLCSGYEVVRDKDNNPIAMVGVDIDMNGIMKIRHRFLFYVSCYIILLMLVLALVALYIIKKKVSSPLHDLTNATSSFMATSENTMNPPMELVIHTGDEIETLCNSIRQMEIDINEYTVNLTSMTAEKERISTELNVAAKIQSDMLPSIFPAFTNRKDFEIFASMKPAKEVGGDFYDFFLIDEDHLAIVIGDVSGKGVPAALFMVIAKTLIKNATRHETSPQAIFEQVNNQLCENNSTGMFVTVWMGIMTISTGNIIAANAGHEYPAVSTANGQFSLIKDKHGLALGAMENMHYREYEFNLEHDASLFVYTDGVTEATNKDNTLFGTDRMIKSLNTNPQAVTEALVKQIHDGISDFVQEAPQFDDITMVAIKRS